MGQILGPFVVWFVGTCIRPGSGIFEGECFEIEFRMNRLSVRLMRLAAHFEGLAELLTQGGDSGNCLKYVQECKFFIEWTGIDLDGCK
jgi:hypothetical protein